MSTPIAIVTGGSSGIGLALAKHLLSKQWKVAIFDVQSPLETLQPSDNVLFIKTDVSSWESNAAAFEQTFKWGDNRLDFVALNAGIDDRDDIFHSLDASHPPRKPSMLTFEVNLHGPYYGCKLAAHYMNLNEHAGGKVVLTSSSSGLRALPLGPQYSATKHGVVGLTRSLGSHVSKKARVTFNAICPNLVVTGLAPTGTLDKFEAKQITPMSTIIRAFEELAEFDGVGERERWVGSGKHGAVVEASLGNLYYRSEVEVPDLEVYQAGNLDAIKAWEEAYVVRNRNFALSKV